MPWTTKPPEPLKPSGWTSKPAASGWTTKPAVEPPVEPLGVRLARTVGFAIENVPVSPQEPPEPRPSANPAWQRLERAERNVARVWWPLTGPIEGERFHRCGCNYMVTRNAFKGSWNVVINDKFIVDYEHKEDAKEYCERLARMKERDDG